MNSDTLLSMLASLDTDMVLDGLFELGAERDAVPDGEVFEQAISHFHHFDPDVRRQAVVAVGVHWGYARAFPELLSLLRAEQDDMVLDAAISAISRIASDDRARVQDALVVLSRVALASNHPPRLRGLAHAEARWLSGRTDPAEHAAEILDPERVPAEDAWLREVASSTPAVPST